MSPEAVVALLPWAKFFPGGKWTANHAPCHVDSNPLPSLRLAYLPLLLLFFVGKPKTPQASTKG
eukprot:6265349-Amphidinium_carterae.3